MSHACWMAFAIGILFLEQTGKAAEVIVHYKRSDSLKDCIVTLSCESKTLQLPKRISVRSLRHSADRRTWAINFHITSNYNGVDLAFCNEGKMTIVSDLYPRIKAQLRAKKILPLYDFDNLTLEVSKIDKEGLECSFYGASFSHRQTFNRSFIINYNHEKNTLDVK